MRSPILTVRDLRISVPAAGGRAEAVSGISFAVDEGERVGLVGESGAGKSLTALALPGLLDPGVRIEPGSSIQLAGDELVGASKARLRAVRGGQMAMVFQDPANALNPALSVGVQIEEVLRLHRGIVGAAARREVVRLLDETGLIDPERTAADLPHRLSGGMRQRACIAMALAGEPRLLVADEPTTALDVTVQARILTLLKQLTEERELALLLISHDLAVVAAACHRVVVLYAGQVVEEGGVERVLGAPRHPYTRALLAARPRLSGPRLIPPPIPGVVPTPTAWPSGCRFHPRCAEVLPRCSVDAPPERTDSRGRVRCWLADESEGVG